ncbi:hypothetical protein NC651_011082 [Populus alba x Populus x berolinensis]|nr:hypothetical protein NC651_011082 [Populus alba x Populus x berolinensis]
MGDFEVELELELESEGRVVKYSEIISKRRQSKGTSNFLARIIFYFGWLRARMVTETSLLAPSVKITNPTGHQTDSMLQHCLHS